MGAKAKVSAETLARVTGERDGWRDQCYALGTALDNERALADQLASTLAACEIALFAAQKAARATVERKTLQQRVLDSLGAYDDRRP